MWTCGHECNKMLGCVKSFVCREYVRIIEVATGNELASSSRKIKQ